MRRSRSRKKTWITLAMLVCAAAFIGSGLYLASYFVKAQQTEKGIEQLQAEKSEDDLTDIEVQEAKEMGIVKKYVRLYKQNEDMIGWLTIKNSKIDYPVMQTKEDNEYYLHRNFEKEEDVNGLPFLDQKCDINGKNQNFLIYGHHMKSGLMFAKLLDYADESYYQNHKEVSFDTLKKSGDYEVVAAFYSRVPLYNDEFTVFDYAGSLNKKRYKKYVDYIKASSLYDTGVKPEYGQNLITMVTCSYHTEDGRFVVVAAESKKK